MHDMAAGQVAEFPRLVGSLRETLQSWDRLIETLPIAVYVCDRNGAIIQYNRRASELWGRGPAPGDTEERFCGSHRLFLPDGRPLAHAATPMAEVLRTGQPARDREVVIERPDGTRVSVLVNIDPILDDRGRFSGAVNCFQDISALRRAHRELQERQHELEDFFENGAVALHIVDAEGTIVRANQAELDLLGYAREEYVGRNVADFHADPNVIAQILASLRNGEKLDRFPARLKAKDGSIREVLVTSNAQFLNGEFVHTRCFTIDVTDWRRAERARKRIADALAESEQRLAATYEQATIGISEADADGRLLRVNEASCAITGFTRDELLRRGPFFQQMRSDEAENERLTYRRQVAGEIDRYTIEKRIRRKDGREVWVSVMSSSVRDADGRFRYAVRVIQDITERKLAEERLRASEKRLREILEAIPAAIYTTDAEGRVTFFNQAAVAFSGRVPQLGTDAWCVSWRLYWPDGTALPHDECPMAIALKEKRPVRDAEAVAERPDGTRVPFIPYPTPLFDENGVLIGAVNMLVDMTDRKKSEQRLKTLNDELNHRVKNTLATVQSLARQTARTAATVKEFEERLQGRLIALSHAHNQLTRRNWDHAELREIVEAELVPYLEGQGVGERVVLEGGAVQLQPRAALTLAMVFHELTTNAAKYGALSRPGGRLEVAWSVESGETGRKLRLSWRERGGPSVQQPAQRGFGTRLVRQSVELELGGAAELAFDPAGISCNIEVPIPSST